MFFSKLTFLADCAQDEVATLNQGDLEQNDALDARGGAVNADDFFAGLHFKFSRYANVIAIARRFGGKGLRLENSNQFLGFLKRRDEFEEKEAGIFELLIKSSLQTVKGDIFHLRQK